MKWKRFGVDVYRSAVYVCLEKDGQKVLERIKRAGFHIAEKHREEILEQRVAGVACPLLGKEAWCFLIKVQTATKTPYDVAVVGHECLHISNYIFESIGLKKGLPTRCDEIQAYLLDYLIEETLTILWS